MDEFRIVFECEYCYSILDSLTTSHNCPDELAPSVLRGPPLPEFRKFLDSLPRRVFVIRGQREFNFLLNYFRIVLFSLLSVIVSYTRF